MIKAIMFDLYNTLITYSPSREDMHVKALESLGIRADKKKVALGLKAGDEYFYRENAGIPVKDRGDEERKKIFFSYELEVFKVLNIEPEPERIKGVLGFLKNVEYRMALFDDVLPALDAIKAEGYKTAIVSNIDSDIRPMCRDLGISTFIDLVLTSKETGLCKPDAAIFHQAAASLQVTPGECVYVGDQYQIDVLGAGNAGMTGVLLDRDGTYDAAGIHGHLVSSMHDIARLIDTISTA